MYVGEKITMGSKGLEQGLTWRGHEENSLG